MSAHPAALMTEARALAADGYGPAVVTRTLAARGTPVPYSTVHFWLSKERQAKQAARDRRRKARRRGGRMVSRSRSPEFKLARLEGLRSAGLSVAAIVAVFHFDCLEPTLTRDQAVYALEHGEWPKGLR